MAEVRRLVRGESDRLRHRLYCVGGAGVSWACSSRAPAEVSRTQNKNARSNAGGDDYWMQPFRASIDVQFMDPATIPDYKVVLGAHAGSRFFDDPVSYLSAGLPSPGDVRL